MSGAVGKSAAVAEGIGILHLYETDPGIDAQHDVINCGATPPEFMSEDSRTRMAQLKWKWNPAGESWYIFT